MYKSYAQASGVDFNIEPDDDIMDSIFKQYERVIIESLITSFGLDFIVSDRHGGDVDTVYNVRNIDVDPLMKYKNVENQVVYENRGEYSSYEYHSDKRYIEKNREIKRQKQSGELKDAYTGESIIRNGKTDLDHVISAKEIHEDAGRILAGLKGNDLANSEENLQATNPHTNRTKKADTMDKFLDKYGEEYTDEQKSIMQEKDAIARKSYERKIAKAYYTSPRFAKDLTLAAGNVGIKMGLRQALGFVFAEVWFAVKEEFSNAPKPFNLEKFLCALGNGVKLGFERAKIKHKELLKRFGEGTVSGIISSLTTTLCNIFFTTAKNFVRVIRQSYVSFVEAAKVLFINPDNLPLGERVRAIVKILSVGASVVVGTIISQSIDASPIGQILVVGEIVQTFCGTLVTGIMSCSLLYFFDRSELVAKLVSVLNSLPTVSSEVNYFRRQAEYFERYAAQMMEIDIEQFQRETLLYSSIVDNLDEMQDENSLNQALKNALDVIGLHIPWDREFDDFMKSKTILVFE